MRISRLPYKARDTDPEWDEREVRKPESLLDWLRLCFVPGQWYDHPAFGMLRIVDPKGRTRKGGRA